MNKIYIPTRKPDDWKQLLADPEKHWRTGYSAKALAYSWENAKGFPSEVKRMFSRSDIGAFAGIEPLLAIPEYKVPLPGGSSPSQNDLFVLAKAKDGLVVIMVEGKVSESFGLTLKEWNPAPSKSKGKSVRYKFLLGKLGLKNPLPNDIRYQLLHRTASAIIEAEKFNAKYAVMLVHTFSLKNAGYDDYKKFVGIFGASANRSRLTKIMQTKSLRLYCGWAKG